MQRGAKQLLSMGNFWSPQMESQQKFSTFLSSKLLWNAGTIR